jgi:hypothetical protein
MGCASLLGMWHQPWSRLAGPALLVAALGLGALAGCEDRAEIVDAGPDGVADADDDTALDGSADADAADAADDTDVDEEADAGADDAEADSGPEPGCYGPEEEPALPERVVFRAQTTSFNQRWLAALQDGLIWVKPNAEAGEPPGDWQLLGTGLPAGGDLTHFEPPTEILELSGDGTWLHALSAAGVFYRGTDFTQDIQASFTWSDAWGHPAATGPGLTTELPTRGWSVSDSQVAGVHHYEDRLGTAHGVGMGVAHLYRLGADGRSLYLNDWWLPADWSRQICLPERGTFFAENLSASASTLFLVGALGELYTRLYDFDTSGENDTLTYSFLITAPAGDTRALPAEDWRRQPDITDGLVTRRLTIFQDGQGNAARVLRVEGVREGRTGFYHKRIFDDAWSFEETGQRVCGPFLNAPGRLPPEPVAPDDHPLSGTLAVDRAAGEDVSIGLEILDFNMVCSPARVHLLVGGSLVTAGGAPLELPLHHVHALVLETRPTAYWLLGIPAKIRAALVLPASFAAVDDPAARATLENLFEDRRGVNFQGEATLEQLTLDEMTWLDPLVGIVPGDEKADPGNALQLRAAAP